MSKQKMLAPQLICTHLQLQVSSVQVTGETTQELLFTCLSCTNNYTPVPPTSSLRTCTFTGSSSHCLSLALLRRSDTALRAAQGWKGISSPPVCWKEMSSPTSKAEEVFWRHWRPTRTSDDCTCDLSCSQVNRFSERELALQPLSNHVRSLELNVPLKKFLQM